MNRQQKRYWNLYERRVAILEGKGMTRSDAQACIDAQELRKPVKLANGTVTTRAALNRYAALYGELPQTPGMQPVRS